MPVSAKDLKNVNRPKAPTITGPLPTDAVMQKLGSVIKEHVNCCNAKTFRITKQLAEKSGIFGEFEILVLGLKSKPFKCKLGFSWSHVKDPLGGDCVAIAWE
jgi:hypothetical protein